jgi:hypothetical protein
MKELFAMSWLKGDRLSAVRFLSEGVLWELSFASGALLNVQCLWRLFVDGSIKCTSEDHGQLFGLKKPFDCVEALAALVGVPILNSAVRNGTTDITITFSSGALLEILQTSGGYESWSAVHPKLGSVFGGSGGELHATGA